MAACARCGAEAPEGARFCASCGSPLAEVRETRKTVTILFCDWVDSTPMGERIDAESIRRLQEAYFAETHAVLERHGGTVEKFIGDAVMAVFGIPRAGEDDGLRAVRAAVELREAIAALNERIASELGVRLAVRTGVNTGEVVTGDAAAGQAFVTGDAVNVAARLEQEAQPGEILIGETTQRLVRDAALLEPVEPLELKGKSERVAAWRVVGVVAGAPGFARRFDSELVGRGHELTLLRQAFERAAGAGAGHLFTVLGAPGVGKSRLVNELIAAAREHATVLIGRCLPYGEGITFWPLVDVVRAAAGIGPRLDPAEARSRIDALLVDEPDGAVAAARIAEALGFDDSAASAEEIFWAIRKLVLALARRRPLVLGFEDVHWAEPTFLDLVEHLADGIRDAPVLLVCLARPELLDERPAWGGGRPNATTIMLEPLGRDECGTLIENLLDADELDDPVKRAIADAGEGNPLFVEEIVASLVDEGVLQRDGGRWVAGDLGGIEVPPTIQALLTARLERLTAVERDLLEVGAVIGRFFSRAAIAELAPQADVDSLLGALVRKELIRPEPDAFAGEDAFRFRHILIRDAAYNSMPKARRAEIHERYADRLERTRGERVREIEEIVGYHLEQAYRIRAELGREGASLAARASAVLSSAGHRALARGDAPAARSLLQRAVGLPGMSETEQLERLFELATACRESGDLRRAEAILAGAVKAAYAAGDPRLEARALIERSYHHFFTDPKTWIEEALPTAERAIPVLEEAGDDLGLSQAWTHVLLFHYSRCRIGEMEDALERALDHAERAGDRRLIATALKMKVQAALVGPLPVDAAISRCEEIAAESRGSSSLEAVAVGVRACLEAMRGRFDEARELSRESRQTLAELGQVRLRSALRSYSGYVELLAGDPKAAEAQLRAGARELEDIGDRGNLETIAAELAQALLLQGRDTEAREYAEISKRMAPTGDLFTQVPWRLVRARLEAKAGRVDEAERLAREAVALAEETDHLLMQGDALLCLGEVLLSARERDEAEAAIREAIARYEDKGNVVSAERARAALAQVAVQT